MSNAGSKVSNIRIVRKNIARILTIVNQSQKENLKKHYKVGYSPSNPSTEIPLIEIITFSGEVPSGGYAPEEDPSYAP